MNSIYESDESRFAPYLADTVQESWARCLPIWLERGRVNDWPREFRFPRYLPSFGTVLGRCFVERFADGYEFLMDRLATSSGAEALCAFDLLDFLARHLYRMDEVLPERLRHCDLPLPQQIRGEVAMERWYRGHDLDTVGKLLSFDFDDTGELTE